MPIAYLGRRRHRARQARDILRSHVLQGHVSTVLPSEDDLVAELGVGRNVVREALGLLVAEGLLVRRRGVGTAASTHVLLHSQRGLPAIAEQDRVVGADVAFHLLAWERLLAPSTVALQLGADVGVAVTMWERVTVGAVPINLWTSYLAPGYEWSCPDTISTPADGGTFGLLEGAGVLIGSAQVRTGAVRADPGVAELLDVSEGDALLVQHRVTTDREGHPVEVGTGYFRPDQIYLATELRRDHDGCT